jgi:hypothetical protein
MLPEEGRASWSYPKGLQGEHEDLGIEAGEIRYSILHCWRREKHVTSLILPKSAASISL